MKKIKIMFWVTTSALFIGEGIIPALTVHSPLSIQGFTHLGYPVYFVTLLTVFKVLGALALIIPAVPTRVREWAYAGFMIDFLSAFISIWAVDGFNGTLLLPVIAIALLVLSYSSYHKLNTNLAK